MIHRSKCKLFAGFQCHWITEIPIVDGEAQLDDAKHAYRSVGSLDEAYKCAKENAAQAEFRVVHITEFVMRPVSRQFPNVLEMEYVGEEICYEDGDPIPTPNAVVATPNSPQPIRKAK